MSRTLSPAFVQDLKNGVLSPLLQTVREDDTLMMCPRGTYLNIYYRGGSILRLAESNAVGHYCAFFDKQYEKDSSRQLKYPRPEISNSSQAQAWADAFKDLKEVMNRFFAKRPKAEREFQQLVAWENNRSVLANGTDYFVIDIEFSDPALGARFDMLALKWLARDKMAKSCHPVLIEMKYGDDAIKGGSDIKKHLSHLTGLLEQPKKRKLLGRMVVDHFNQLTDLGLLKYDRNLKLKANGLQHFEADCHPEVVFLIANHNPRSKTLLEVLQDLDVSGAIQEAQKCEFDVRFFVSTFAGYALHDASMLGFEQFKTLVSDQLQQQRRTASATAS